MSLPVFSKQGSEAGLLEVPVVGQRVGYVPLLHDKKARAVREAPTLVTARRVPFHGGPELRVRLKVVGYFEFEPRRPLTLTLSPRRDL